MANEKVKDSENILSDKEWHEWNEVCNEPRNIHPLRTPIKDTCKNSV